MAKKPEAKVKDRVRETLHAYGIVPIQQYDEIADSTYWQPGATLYGTSGQPDFIIVIRGKIMTVETKATTKLTANQERFYHGIGRAGGVALVIHQNDEAAFDTLCYLIVSMREEPMPTMEVRV